MHSVRKPLFKPEWECKAIPGSAQPHAYELHPIPPKGSYQSTAQLDTTSAPDSIPLLPPPMPRLPAIRQEVPAASLHSQLQPQLWYGICLYVRIN